MIEKQSSERFAIYRRCRLEEVDLPLLRGDLAKVPLEEHAPDLDEMDIDSLEPVQVKDYGIEVDFDSSLSDDAKDDGEEAKGQAYEKRLADLATDIEKMAPNLRAIDK